MKVITKVTAAAVGVLLAGSVIPASAHAAVPDGIENDTVWVDTAGQPIRAQGGNVLKVGSLYYWVGAALDPTPAGASTAPKSINLYSSSDLENWTLVRPIVTQSGTTGDLAVGKWLGRPSLVHNPTTGQFVLVVEVPGERTNSTGSALGNGVAFFTSSAVDGTYTYQGKQFPNNLTKGDGTVFVDGDDAYLIYVGDSAQTRNVSMNVAPLSSDWLTILPDISTQTNYTNEAPAVVKVGATFYMFASGKDWWNATPTSYRTSTDMANWSSWSTVPTEPFSGTSFGTQFEQIIPVVGSAGTSYLYNGDRYSQFAGTGVPAPTGIGRNAWYPLTFSSTGVPTLHGATDVDVNATAGTLMWSEVANGRFDQKEAGTVIPQWEVTGSSGAVRVENTTSVNNRKLRISSASAHNGWAAQNLTLPNGTYTLSVDYRSSGGQNSAYFSVKNHGAAETRIDLKAAAGDWTTRTVTFTVTTGVARIGVWADGAGGRWLDVDNISVWRQ